MKPTNISLFILSVLFICFSCSKNDDNNDSQTQVDYSKTLRPSAIDGQDAFIYTFNMDANLGTHPDFMVYNGGSNITRCFMRFDFSEIPTMATIDSVKLSLYSYTSSANGSHGVGNNRSLLQKVNSAWSEDAITWNNQPTSSDLNQVVLEPTEATIEDYLDIDITQMAIEMIQNPSSNHGFVFKLEDESAGGKMVFASSDNNDADLHPKLEIYYSVIE